VSADPINERVTLKPYSDYFIRVHLNPGDNYPFNFQSNNTFNIYFLDTTNLGLYLQNNSFSYFVLINNWTSHSEEWNATFLNTTYHIPFNSNNVSQGLEDFYLLLKNVNNTYITIFLTLDYQNQTLPAMADAAQLGLTIGIGTLSFFLYIRSIQFKKIKETYKFKMLRNYSYGFAFGFLNYLSGDIVDFYGRDYIHPLYPNNIIAISPLLHISIDIPQFLGLLLFGVMIFFIIYGIERQLNPIGRLKYSFLIFIGIMSLIVGYLVPIILDFTLAIFVISILIGILYFARIYGQVIRSSFGIVRLKAFIIIASIILLIFFGITRQMDILGNVDASRLLNDSLSIIALFLFYYGCI
jgi:hypothetical protein